MDASRNPVGTLLFRPGALGDTMLTIDAIHRLRQRFPAEPIELVGNAHAGRLLVSWGLVDRTTSFDDPVVTSLFATPPRVAERWQQSRRVVLWLRNADDIAEAFRQAASADVICAWAEPPPNSDLHVADHLTATLAPLIGATSPERRAASELDFWSGQSSRTVLVHPGSGSPRKNWPADRFAGLVSSLLREEEAVKLISGPADDEAVQNVLGHLPPDAPEQLEIYRPGDVPQLAQILAQARLYVGNDSGVSHVSGRVGVPTLVIFGATDPRHWAPRGPRVVVLGSDRDWPALRDVREAAATLLGLSNNSRGNDSAGPPRAHLDQNGARV